MPIPRDASVGKIIKIEMAAGKPRKQAIAIAMRKKGKSKDRPKSVPANQGREGGTRAAESLPVNDSRLYPRLGERFRGMRMAQLRTSQREDTESTRSQQHIAKRETHETRAKNQDFPQRERFSNREMDIYLRLDQELRESGIDRLKRERRERQSNSPGQA